MNVHNNKVSGLKYNFFIEVEEILKRSKSRCLQHAKTTMENPKSLPKLAGFVIDCITSYKSVR
jgi:hypothetical protein